MKICFIVPSLAKSGPIIVVKNLVAWLVSQGHDCLVCYFDDKFGIEFECKTQKISFRPTPWLKDYDIVHSHGIRPDLFLALNKLIYGIKAISTIHNYVFDDLKYQYNIFIAIVFSLLWRILWIYFDRVVVLTNHAKEYYSKYLSAWKIGVVYNGISFDANIFNDIDDNFLAFAALARSNGLLIGSCSLLTKRKGIDIVLRAMVDLKNVYYVIVGDGKEKDALCLLAKELGVFERCLFIGFKNNPLGIISQLDFFVMPSRSEGLPISILEAMALRKALIVSSLPVFKEVFAHKEAVIFESENVDSLIDSIKYASKNKKALENDAFSLYKDKFSLSAMGNGYEQQYKMIRYHDA